ncbi:hypothetical protein, partial [Agromyces humi]|uniref:hypothetical protein n=1 Tax=Agromyces humi TaxID=1766800 RepID=UPI001939A091
AGLGWLVWACVTGVVLGLVGLVVVQVIRRRIARGRRMSRRAVLESALGSRAERTAPSTTGP